MVFKSFVSFPNDPLTCSIFHSLSDNSIIVHPGCPLHNIKNVIRWGFIAVLLF